MTEVSALNRNWSTALTIIVVILAATILAWQQALTDAPNVRAVLPAFAVSPRVNYAPAILLIIAGIVWLFGRWFSAKQPVQAPASALPVPNSSVQPLAIAGTPSVVPVVGLTLRNTWMDARDNSGKRWYPRKLNLQFSNDSDDEIRLGVGHWIKDQIGLQTGHPLRPAVYQFRTHLGTWSDEFTDGVVVYPNQWLKVWIGIDSTPSDNDATKFLTEGKIGTLEIPAEISGEKIKLRVRPQKV